MNNLEPSQFFEMILSQQNHFSKSEIPLNVRIFNKMVDELTDLDFSIKFGYSDFTDFIESYYESVSIKQNVLYIAYTKELLQEVRKYNRIHENIADLITTKDLWVNYLK